MGDDAFLAKVVDRDFGCQLTADRHVAKILMGAENLIIEKVLPGPPLKHDFEESSSAHWVRLRADKSCTASEVFTYE